MKLFNCIHVIVTHNEGQTEMVIGFKMSFLESENHFLKMLLTYYNEVTDAPLDIIKISCCIIGNDRYAQPLTPQWYNDREGKWYKSDLTKQLR